MFGFIENSCYISLKLLTLVDIKKLITISLVTFLAVSALSARAEDEYTYLKLFEEGKTWNVVDEYYDPMNKGTFMVDQQVSFDDEWQDGDYIVSRVSCFNQQDDTSHSCSFLEENGIIYTKYNQTYRKLIDFNLRKGDSVPVEYVDVEGETTIKYRYVVNDEIIDIKGIKRKIISIGFKKDDIPFAYWIEGIGSIDDWGMLVVNYPMPTCVPYLTNRHISSCYLNGECIFSYEDFEEYMQRSGVRSIGEDIKSGYLSYGGNSIKVNGCTGNATVEVYSMDGTLRISEEMTGSHAVSISDLPSGCYLVRATFRDGSSDTLKFIK